MRKLLIDMDKPEKLTHKRFLFCLYLVGEANYNATKAYELAGFSPDGAQENSSRLMALDIIKETISKLEEDKLKAAQITGENILVDIKRLKEKAEEKGELNTAVRAAELLGRGKLWEKGGRGIKAEIDKGADGTMKITFEEGE